MWILISLCYSEFHSFLILWGGWVKGFTKRKYIRGGSCFLKWAEEVGGVSVKPHCSSWPLNRAPSLTDPAFKCREAGTHPWVLSIQNKRRKLRVSWEAMEQNGKEHICVCSFLGRVGMGKGGKVQYGSVSGGRVQIAYILGPFWIRKYPQRNFTAGARTA